MSITGYVEVTADTTTSKSASGVTAFTGALTRVFRVAFSADHDIDDRPVAAIDYEGLPQTWQPHPSDPYMYVVGHQCAFDSPGIYKVTVTYERIPDPLEARPVVRITHATSSEAIDKDRDDKAIVNSSDETLETPVEKNVSDLVIRVEYNVATFDHVLASNLKDGVNKTKWHGHAAGTCRIEVFDAEEMRAGDLFYWRTTLEVHVRADGWGKRVLDQGYRIKSGIGEDGTMTYHTLVDGKLQPMTSPSLLNGAGHQLNWWKTPPDDPVFITYDVCLEKDFGKLNLDLEML